MRVPRYILDVFNEKYGFERLFNHFMAESDTQQEAFDKTVAEIEKYIPGCTIYANLQSFQAHKAKRLKKYREDVIEVPKEALTALRSRDDLYELYWKFYRRNYHSGHAYKAMMEYLHKWVPNFQPYSSAQSFRKVMNRKRSKGRD